MDEKTIVRLDTPGLTRQQKFLIGAKNILWAFSPLLLYLFLPGLCMSIGMLIRGWNRSTDDFIRESGNFYTTAGIIIAFAIIFYRMKKRKEDFFQNTTLFLDHIDWLKAAWYAVLGLSLSVFLSSLITLFPVFRQLTSSYKNASELLFRGTDLLLIVLSLVVFAPVLEEIVFRGLMLNRLLTQFSERTSILIVSAAFAMCHGNLLWILYTFFAGYILTKTAMREDNILYSIVIHMGFNFPSVLNIMIRHNEEAASLFFENPVLIAAYGILSLMVLIVWFRSDLTYKREENL